MSSTSERLRMYRRIRTAHLERLDVMVPAVMAYDDTRTDFDISANRAEVNLVRLGRLRAIVFLLRRSFTTIELFEPSVVRDWPDLVARLSAIRLRDFVTRRHTEIVTYCIGIADPAEEFAVRRHIPTRAARVVTQMVLRWACRRLDRMAFGTTGSYHMYTSYVPESLVAPKSSIFEAVPSRCSCLSENELTKNNRVMFVGAFASRKGIDELMAAWDCLRRSTVDADLVLIGRDAGANLVAWARERAEVRLIHDPPRDVIHEELRGASVLVLLSQPSFGYWREQIGLPILEGLSHGCEVVTTTETGIASWLRDHGHGVLDPAATPGETARALTHALDQAKRRPGSLDDLPAQDQRIAADGWMMEPR